MEGVFITWRTFLNDTLTYVSFFFLRFISSEQAYHCLLLCTNSISTVTMIMYPVVLPKFRLLNLFLFLCFSKIVKELYLVTWLTQDGFAFIVNTVNGFFRCQRFKHIYDSYIRPRSDDGFIRHLKKLSMWGRSQRPMILCISNLHARILTNIVFCNSW